MTKHTVDVVGQNVMKKGQNLRHFYLSVFFFVCLFVCFFFFFFFFFLSVIIRGARIIKCIKLSLFD